MEIVIKSIEQHDASRAGFEVETNGVVIKGCSTAHYLKRQGKWKVFQRLYFFTDGVRKHPEYEQLRLTLSVAITNYQIKEGYIRQ